MKDFNGNELSVGDQVVFIRKTRTSSWLEKGSIEKITPKMVFVYSSGCSYKMYPQDNVYKIPG
jgi:hypothetical protein